MNQFRPPAPPETAKWSLGGRSRFLPSAASRGFRPQRPVEVFALSGQSRFSAREGSGGGPFGVGRGVSLAFPLGNSCCGQLVTWAVPSPSIFQCLQNGLRRSRLIAPCQRSTFQSSRRPLCHRKKKVSPSSNPRCKSTHTSRSPRQRPHHGN